ncbi:DegV family protein [Agathobaculum sp. Marseille-P7918]|uniref:DegV family protein n=1 Tax=Agathobaculum sp. Marseille-P7918 TaxID=2479843 RepID=UPI003569F045
MYPFTLVTDSTIDETASYFSQNEIKCVPLAFTIDNRTIEEDCGQTVSFHQFYDLLRQGKQSSTSQAKLDTFLTIFREALDAGQDVLYIGFSSGLSGTFHAGCMARDELAPLYPERKIFCVDSLSATGGEYLLVDKAREMRDSGCTAEITAAAIEQMRLHVIHLVTVDDLGHLHRGGRLSKTSAVVGSLLGIKPLIWVDNEGKLSVCGKVRGRQKAIQYLADRTVREMSDKKQIVRICHGDCPEDAQKLADLLKKSGVQSDIRYIGTVIGSHTGPGVLTTFFFGGDRKPE